MRYQMTGLMPHLERQMGLRGNPTLMGNASLRESGNLFMSISKSLYRNVNMSNNLVGYIIGKVH